jgi:hypothetical protein
MFCFYCKNNKDRERHVFVGKRTLISMLGLGLAGWGLFQARQQIFRHWLHLPPVEYAVGVERGLRLTLPDGVTLVADHYFPKAEGDFPTILIRTPYGRKLGAALVFIAPRFAERGYHVIIQDTRGRFDSTGQFDPFRTEAEDGHATLDWIAQQPWFNGVIGMWGQSYLGFVQWAVAGDPPPALKAIMPIITASQFVSLIRADSSFALDTMLRWTFMVDTIDFLRKRTFAAALLRLLRTEQLVAPALRHLPIGEADAVAIGAPVSFYRDWLDHQIYDHYWKAMDHRDAPGRTTTAAHLIAGWYDIFLRDQLLDYEALRAAGKRPYLTIGPWFHLDTDIARSSLGESLAWFDAHLKDDHRHLRPNPVRIYVMGADEWRDMEEWPPPTRETRYYLQSGQQLAPTQPDAHAPPDQYRYNPSDPTPSIGGPLMNPGGGPRDNRALETRPDLLCYTTEPLHEDLEVIGNIDLELYVHSTLKHTDFFGRLCDLHPDGQSINICDGLLRIEGGRGEPQPDGTLRIVISMWATAHCFRRGHCLRLQIASGAHPRWSRNLGTGEPIATGTAGVIAEQSIYHDSTHPSALVLPIV